MLVDGVSIAEIGTTKVDNVLVITDVGTIDGTRLGLAWAGRIAMPTGRCGVDKCPMVVTCGPTGRVPAVYTACPLSKPTFGWGVATNSGPLGRTRGPKLVGNGVPLGAPRLY